MLPSWPYEIDFCIGKSRVFEIWVDDTTFFECAEQAFSAVSD